MRAYAFQIFTTASFLLSVMVHSQTFAQLPTLSNVSSIDPETIAFVYAADGYLGIESPNGEEAMRLLIDAEYPFEPNNWKYLKAVSFDSEIISHFEEITSVNVGDEYLFYSFDDKTLSVAAARGYGFFPTGDGGSDAVAIALEIPSVLTNEKEFGPKGVVWKRLGETNLSAPFAHISEMNDAHLRRFVEQSIPGAKVDSFMPLSSGSEAEKRAALAIVDMQGDKFVCAILFGEFGAKIVPVNSDNPLGIKLHEMNAEHGGAQVDGTVHILPDIDGDGIHEFAVVSTTSTIHALRFYPELGIEIVETICSIYMGC